MMSRKKLIYLLLIFSPFLLSLPVTLYFLRFSQAPGRSKAEAGVLFQENFNEGAVKWDYYHKAPGDWIWSATGGVEGGVFHHLYPSSGTWGHDDFAYLKEQNFTDFSAEAAIKILAGNAGIQGRVTLTGLNSFLPVITGYRCDLTTEGKIKIQRYLLTQPDGQSGDHRNPLELASANFAWQLGQWYRLKMEISGNKISCFVDGNLKVEYTDTNSLTNYEKSQGKTQNGAVFKNGTIGFITYKADSYWDNITVRSLSGGDGEVVATPVPTTAAGGQTGGKRCVVIDDNQDERHGICCQQSQCYDAGGQLKRLPKDSAAANGCGTVQDQESIWCCSYCNGIPAPTPVGGYPTERPEVAPTNTPPSGSLQATLTPTATTIPASQENIPYLVFRVKFEGFDDSNQPKMAVILKVKNTDFAKTVIVSGGVKATEPINLPNFVPGKTYEFLLSSWGYLSVKESLALNSGNNEHNQIDFGTLKVGDLNGDNQINGIDWSLMKTNFGKSGEE